MGTLGTMVLYNITKANPSMKEFAGWIPNPLLLTPPHHLNLQYAWTKSIKSLRLLITRLQTQTSRTPPHSTDLISRCLDERDRKREVSIHPEHWCLEDFVVWDGPVYAKFGRDDLRPHR